MTNPMWLQKNLENADEVRDFPNNGGSLRVFSLGEETVGYATFNAGFKWSKDMKEAAGTNSCQLTHNFYVLSGRMAIVPDDGKQFEVGPGDFAFVAPGHDAWTVGDEPCIMVDWTAARPSDR